MHKNWYRGKWRVSKEVAPIVVEMLNSLTKRGLEIKSEGEIYEFFSYHPVEHWEGEKNIIEHQIILFAALFPDAVINCEWEKIPDKNWQKTWYRYFKPQRITSRLVILPPWEKYQAKPNEITIRIKPGMAFGTGTHETTQLCLKKMLALYPKEKPQSLLDVGTGTGILAILGAKMGIKDIMAIDTDPVAIEAAKENVKLNNIRNIQILLRSLEKIEKSFDWVVANLETSLILSRANCLKSCTKKTLILSGILKGEVEVIKSVLDLPCREINSLKEWVCMLF
ncbi:Ribosomal L11 methyltransferase [Candidatus Desulfofervidus auxilii]|uniref:Ribosomal L11 methyltransferase n=1 Tax=Desulfofervidus auxilii TaxID=1621989 RepID=A0A7U4TIN7_DESA2|nr:50S ribosomal protein L11 methyltransferase [Candidatus Desulfofervidus auxilii]AMM41508.1 Ribosomal L11 methyltransferase [Candidatus Desulfofervidus auxilii]